MSLRGYRAGSTIAPVLTTKERRFVVKVQLFIRTDEGERVFVGGADVEADRLGIILDVFDEYPDAKEGVEKALSEYVEDVIVPHLGQTMLGVAERLREEREGN
jgi:hypothetical protein